MKKLLVYLIILFSFLSENVAGSQFSHVCQIQTLHTCCFSAREFELELV